MRNLVKTLVFVVVLQIILQIILVLPFVFWQGGDYVKSGSLFEIMILLLIFAVSLFASLTILKVKNKHLDFRLFNFRLSVIYFAGGVVSIFYGISYVQLIGYPVLAFLITKVYLKNQEALEGANLEVKKD